jgi:hypothetical protein
LIAVLFLEHFSLRLHWPVGGFDRQAVSGAALSQHLSWPRAAGLMPLFLLDWQIWTPRGGLITHFHLSLYPFASEIRLRG